MTSPPELTAPRRRAARSDGLRNRQQVLDAAADAFAADGLSASVREIAANASVGVGTLYRHFPTKEILLAEVVKARLEELLDVARGLSVSNDADDPAAPLIRWMEVSADHVSHFTAVGSWISQALRSNPDLRPLHEQIRAEGETLLRTAQRAGRASASATIDDVMSAVVALSGRPTDDPKAPRRLLALLIGGVVPPAAQSGSIPQR